jgi:hypothetical protein
MVVLFQVELRARLGCFLRRSDFEDVFLGSMMLLITFFHLQMLHRTKAMIYLPKHTVI